MSYDGQRKTVTVTVKDGVEGVGEISGIHYYAEDGTQQQAPVEPGDGVRTVRIDVAEGEYYEAANGLGGDDWTIQVEKATPTASDYNFQPPAEPVYTGEAFLADFEIENEKVGAITGKRYYVDDVETEPVAPGTYTVKIDVEETDYYKAEWGITSDEWSFTIAPAALTAEGSCVACGTYGDTLSRLTVSGPVVRFGEQEISGVWTIPGDTVPDVGDDGTYTAVFTPEEHPEYYQTLTAEVTLEIAKAEAPAIPDIPVSYSWASRGDKAVTISGLPEKVGAVGDWNVIMEGDTGIFASDSQVEYSDGKLFLTLGENTEENIGSTVTLTVTLPTQNYYDMTFQVIVTLTEKGEQQALDPGAFDLVVTGSGEELTAALVTEQEGVEYSFDGVNWGTESTITVGHGQSVTGYVRFMETEELNVGPVTSKTVNAGHGTLTHHDRMEPTCIQEGNIEYFSCDVCNLYFTDESGVAEITPAATVLAKTSHTAGEAVKEKEIPATCTEEGSYDEVVYCAVCHEKCSTEHKTVPATGHDWSEELTSNAAGHWHKCKTCGAAGYVEQHISGGAATVDKAEICTVCGYEIAPKKTADNNADNNEENDDDNTSDDNGGGNNSGNTSGDNGGNNSTTADNTAKADNSGAGNRNEATAAGNPRPSTNPLMDGTRIQAPATANLKVTTIHSLDISGLRGTEDIQFEIGAISQPTELTVSLQKEDAGRFANLYRKDDEGLVFVDNVRIDEKGYARDLKVTEEGSYVIMICDFSDRAGDVDNDGIVTQKDVSVILEKLVELGDAENSEMLDYNGDGRINALDAAKLLQDLAAGQM